MNRVSLCVAALSLAAAVGCQTQRPADNGQRAGGTPTLGDQSGPTAAGTTAEHGSANGGWRHVAQRQPLTAGPPLARPRTGIFRSRPAGPNWDQTSRGNASPRADAICRSPHQRSTRPPTAGQHIGSTFRHTKP